MIERSPNGVPLVFTTPVFGEPAIGGPELRIRNTIQALARVGQLHIVRRLGSEITLASYPPKYFGESAYHQVAESLKSRHSGDQCRPLLERTRSFVTSGLGMHTRRHAMEIVKLAHQVNTDVIWCGFGNISYPLIRALKRVAPGLKLVCDTDSVWSRFVLRELPLARLSRKPEIALRGTIKRWEERQLTRLADVTTAVSDVDADYYREIAADQRRVHVFRNVIDLSTYADAPLPPRGFSQPAIFLGGSFYSADCPMVEAARWLIAKVMPLVWKQFPACRLYLVGRGSNAISWTRPNSTACERVVATGQVDSVLPYLRNSDVAVVPLHFESGTRFKILEAGACRVPVVSTTLGAEGLPVLDRVHALIADKPADFAVAINRIISDKPFARTLSDACYQLVSESFTVKALADQAVGILDFLKRK